MGHKEVIESVESWPTSPSVERNTLDALIAIYQLLDERLPEKPMTTIVPAVKPGVEDDSIRQGVDGLITFTCDAKPTDSISIDPGYVNSFSRRLFIDFDVENEDEKSIGLSVEDARRFAKAILREVGEA